MRPLHVVDMDNTPITFTLLGATRGIGRALLDQALERGLHVRALVRPGSELPVAHPSLAVIRGDATDEGDLMRAIEGSDAVLSALGAPARNKDHVRESAARATLQAMRKVGTRRLIAVSVYGVGETKAHLPFVTRNVVFPLFLKHAIADHERQEAVIRDSDVQWTLVRPPYLVDGPATGEYAEGFTEPRGLTWKVSRADVAHYMLNLLTNSRHIHKAVGLSYRAG